MGIGATLDIRPDGRLDGFITISGNLLKFINGHQTGFISRFKVLEYLIEGDLGNTDITHLNVPAWLSKFINCNACTE